MKSVIAAFGGAAIALAVYIVAGLPVRRPAPRVATTAATATPLLATATQPLATLSSPRAPSAPVEPNLPPTLQQAIVNDGARLHDERDLDGYLSDLEARARKQGRVTSFEIEPAFAAMQRFVPPEHVAERIGQYSRHMAELSRQLDGRTDEPPTDPGQLADLARRIEHSADEGARQARIREYLDGAARLPPDQQAAAMQQLTLLNQRNEPTTSNLGENR